MDRFLIGKPLNEHMGISAAEIKRRLHIHNVSDGDISRLRELAPLVEENLDQIIEEFYKHQVADSEISKIIGDLETLKKLHKSMRRYISTLFQADYDIDYVNSRLQIGRVHKRLNVTARLFIRSQSELRKILETLFKANIDSSRESYLTAFRKAILFDTEIIFESYIDSFITEAEWAQTEVDLFASELGLDINHYSDNANSFFSKDSLTGLYNRSRFYEYLERELDVARRYELELCLLFFDLNGFKQVNDTYGHGEGDLLLETVADVLRSTVREIDVAARYGGDEFVILMPRTSIENAKKLCERLKLNFEESVPHDVTFSLGVVQTGPEIFLKSDQLISRADEKMYEAKLRSRQDGQYHIAT